MRTSGTGTFRVVDAGFDDYPGDGLRLQFTGEASAHVIDKSFIDVLGLQIEYGDTVEVTVRVKSRRVTKDEEVQETPAKCECGGEGGAHKSTLLLGRLYPCSKEG